MTEPNETLDIIENAVDDETNEYPLIIRIFGVVSIIAGALQVNAFFMALMAVFFGEVDLTELEHHTITTLVIGLVSLALSTALAAMFVALGVRLLRGKRHQVALLSNIMIGFEALVLICHFMLTGLSSSLITPCINMLILIALESYSDPALRKERELQRQLLALDRKAEAEAGTLGLDTTGKGYIELHFYNIFWVFVVCCVLGLVIEVIYHMVVVDPGVYQDRAGLLWGPFSPIYGFGAVLMTVALNRFHDKNPILIFVVSGIIGGAFEFFVSWFMEVAFGLVAWDYTGTFLSIGGRTNFMFMCMWGTLGLVWIKFILQYMLKLVNRIPWNWRYGVTAVCAALMAFDCFMTLAAFDCWYQRMAGTMEQEDQSAIVEYCNEHFDNDFMANRFQSMSIDPSNASRAKK